MRREPLIIGAGPAGAAAAIRLGLAGHQPWLIERSCAPANKVCGDFLGADAIERLADLGVDPISLGAACIGRLRLMHRDRVTECALPFPAVGLSRRLLDEALLRRAEATGSRVRLGQVVRRIVRGPNGWQVSTASGETITAADVFLATGKHDLRDLPRPGAERGAVGMKMYFRLSPRQMAALDGVIALLLFPGGYAGLQRVEANQAVLCIAIGRARFQAIGGTWADLLAAITSGSRHLNELLAGGTPLLPRALAVAGVPYGFLHQSPPAVQPDQSRDGLFRLGDQAAVIPSLTGDGIAIALHSGVLAARVWRDGDNASEYHHRFARDLGGQMRLAGLLHRVAMTGTGQVTAVRVAAWCPVLLRQAARGTRLQRRTTIDEHEQMSGCIRPEPAAERSHAIREAGHST